MTDPDFLQVPPIRIVETERLRLRTVMVADAAAILPIITDKTTMKFTSGVVANDLDIAERWLGSRCLGKDVLNFVITLKDNGPKEQIVGIMGSYHWPEIGYLMNPAYAGRGYATEALRAYLTTYFDVVPSPTASGAMGFDYVQAETDDENIASQKVLLKCGFELVEKLENSFESPSLGLRNTLVYKIARPGMTLESLEQVEKPVRLLEIMGRAGPSKLGYDKAEEGFVPPVQ